MFTERFARYLQFEKRFSSHTVDAYQQDLIQFENFLDSAGADLLSISHQDIRSWVLDMMDRSYEARTISRKLSVLRSFYKFLQREGLIQHNPTLQIRAPKIPRRLPVVVDEQKMDELLNSGSIFKNDFSGTRDRLIIELLYGTGIRLSELVGLKDTDIDLYGQHIRVLGKRNKERIMPVGRPLMQLIRAYIDQKICLNFDNKGSALIVTDTGRNAYPKMIYRTVNTYLAKISSQDKKSPHVLRHTFATTLLNKGADLNAIKELLGHASLAATQVYTHNSVEKLKSIYKQAHPKA